MSNMKIHKKYLQRYPKYEDVGKGYKIKFTEFTKLGLTMHVWKIDTPSKSEVILFPTKTTQLKFEVKENRANEDKVEA